MSESWRISMHWIMRGASFICWPIRICCPVCNRILNPFTDQRGVAALSPPAIRVIGPKLASTFQIGVC
jgi:hypothetical protein